jgi:ribosomal protein L37AE/L43A
MWINERHERKVWICDECEQAFEGLRVAANTECVRNLGDEEKRCELDAHSYWLCGECKRVLAAWMGELGAVWKT